MQEEWVDILTETGEPTGKSCTKNAAHKNGYFHGTVHIWLYTKKGEVLIQLRKVTKINFPNLWDVSVAGHISKGETVVQAAIREVQEEIGLKIVETDLFKIGIHKSMHTHRSDYIDNEFNHVFLCELNTNIERLSIQDLEISAIRLIAIDAYKIEVNNPDIQHLYVPYNKSYLNLVFKEIDQITS